METRHLNPANHTKPSLLPQKPKRDLNAPAFMQALTDAVKTVTSKTSPAEPATLAPPVRPRSHLNLISLNPIQTHYTPEAAALEKVGSSRIVPFTVGGLR
ncbi:hypothetical protein [Pseudomonas sp. UBA1879]|uniref:hypothetical protein n=1 Tax=Pseudomonas sp. UBA1879 TaxID=1947305 RepID=UPI0025D63AAA|nr:hypothetical protein [Pseudomonas sp. UBA1879]